MRLRILTSAAAAHDQFYLPEVSSCWGLDGSACVPGAAAIATAVTRYTCFIVAPGVGGACSAANQGACPPYHVALNGTRIARNDTVRWSAACPPVLPCCFSHCCDRAPPLLLLPLLQAHFPYSCYFQHCPPNVNNSGGCYAYSNPNPQVRGGARGRHSVPR